MTTELHECRLTSGQGLLTGEILLPRLVLKQSAFEHNVQRMAHYCRARGVSLAPHAKTTMSPRLLRRQSDAGVWGFTVATVQQAQKLRNWGVQRILIANQVVEPRAIAWLAKELSIGAGSEILVLVDSLHGVSLLNSILQSHQPTHPLGVLIELAEHGGRAGCRTDEEATLVADAVKDSPHLYLAGLEGFEALVKPEGLRAFMGRLRTQATQLARSGHFANAEEVIVSVGTSEHIELTVEELAGWELTPPMRVLLRPGGYATNSIMPGYRPSLEIWGAVLSRPEPGLAIVGFGHRDVPSAGTRPDQAELPRPIASAAFGLLRDITDQAKVTRLYDQHAVVELNGAELDVGHLLGCSVVSPYRPSFATWRTIPFVNDGYHVVDVLDVLY